MSRSSSILGGLLATFGVSVFAMILVPQGQLGGLQPSFNEEEAKEGRYTEIYPVQNTSADQGREIYIREGCYTCHSQQVRDPQNGTDIERGWGKRRTVARDYLFDRPVVLGNSRLGPDLTNVGSTEWRNEPKDDTRKPAKRNAAWQYLHLYEPRVLLSESNHPPYRYLFDQVKVSGERSSEALDVTGPHGPKEGYQIVPSPAAKALVAYLLTLDRSQPLKEAGEAPGTPAAGAANPPAAK